MAEQLQTFTISAPAFMGLNTQDSPVDADPKFAAIADNCVIDEFGRIGARRGYSMLTTDSSPLTGSNGIIKIHEHEASLTNVVFSAGNNKIFTGTTTLTDVTVGTVTADNWKIVPFNGKSYFFQKGHEPLVYDGTLQKISAHANYLATVPEGNECLAAFGRLWVADIEGDTSTVYWSDLLIGEAWSGGTSGSINITTVWPDGYDEIVALAAHNNFLIIFGRNSIVVYQGADDPSTMTLADTVAGVGCIERDTVQSIGGDVLFLSQKGLQAFGRTIQENALPINDVSRHIHDGLLQYVRNETQPIDALFSPENGFYLLLFRGQNTVFCFDTKVRMQDGALRVTRWPNVDFKCFHVLESGQLYTGTANGIALYTSYTDGDAGYTMTWQSHPMSMGDASRLKILKRIAPVVIGGAGVDATIRWAFDFSEYFNTQTVAILPDGVAEWGVSEYNVDEFAGGDYTNREWVHGLGSGNYITVGITADIDTSPISLQTIGLEVLLGRMI